MVTRGLLVLGLGVLAVGAVVVVARLIAGGDSGDSETAYATTVRISGGLPRLEELPPEQRVEAVRRAMESNERHLAAQRSVRPEPAMTDELRGTVLVRTWFGDDAAWSRLVERVLTPSEEGFLANVSFVDQASFEGLGPAELLSRHAGGGTVAFLADETAMTSDDAAIVAVWIARRDADDDRPETYAPFRVAARALWGVENNISEYNVDWSSFASAVDADGVFREFRPRAERG
ncbi:MAG: DUF6924 domain-containing protein [Sporichthyaceae bacterium]